MTSLLDRFLREELSQHALTLIDEETREAESFNLLEDVELNFNVFDVIIRFSSGRATLYDVLDPSIEETLSLADLISALKTQNI